MHREYLAENLALRDYLAQACTALDAAAIEAAKLGTGGALERKLNALSDDASALWEMADMYEEIRETEREGDAGSSRKAKAKRVCKV